MKLKLIMLTLAVSCTFAGNAMALSKDEYKVQKERIEMEYKASHDKCASLSANAKDICQAEAKGTEKVAKAELEAQYKPNPSHDKKIRDAKADAAYDVAKEKCDDLAGNAKNVCVKEAQAARTTAKADAKVSKVSADANKDKAADMAGVQKDAAVDKRDAGYEVAKARCDSLAGGAKDGCLNDAKAKFGVK
jgi:hypothetical protein